MSRHPTLSVVIPTYRRPAQLGRCLESIAALDYPASRIEVIVVDDDATSPPAPVVDALRDRCEVTLLRQANAGPGAARNTGATRAGGELLAFVDDDVRVGPGWASALAAAARAHPGAAIGGRTLNVLATNPYAATSERIVELAYRHYNSQPTDARFFAANNLALPADGFGAVGGFDPSFRTSEDRDLCDRWRASGRPMVYVPAAVVEHANPLTLSSFWRQQLGYGRGAFAYHAVRRRSGMGLSGFDASFYVMVAREAAGWLRRGDVRRAALLGVWQSANVAGFVREALRRRAPRPAAHPPPAWRQPG